MIRLDLATDRLMNISRKGSSQPTICSAGIPDDTVQTSLPVLCGADLPDWKQEAQHAHCGGPVELYEDLKP